MQIRKFEANSFEEALSRVKAEMGPNALILASEEKRGGLFKKPRIEITAALQKAEEKQEDWDDSDLEQIFPHRRRSEAPAGAVRATPKARVATPTPTAPLASSGARVARETEDVEKQFRDLGISASCAQEFARQLVFDFPRKDRCDHAFLEKVQTKLLAAGLKTLGPEVFETRRHWAAVGTPGSGKTSVLVKLALALRTQGKIVGLSTCDRRKIVGRHELAAYARLLNVPLLSHRAGEKNPNQIRLLDTPSLSWDQPDLLKEVEKNCRDASTVVVLDASQRLDELLHVVDRLAVLAPVAVAFTRLDVVSRAGVVYDVLKATKLPLLGMSLSHGFSLGFRFFESTALARYLVRKPTQGSQLKNLIEGEIHD